MASSLGPALGSSYLQTLQECVNTFENEQEYETMLIQTHKLIKDTFINDKSIIIYDINVITENVIYTYPSFFTIKFLDNVKESPRLWVEIHILPANINPIFDFTISILNEKHLEADNDEVILHFINNKAIITEIKSIRDHVDKDPLLDYITKISIKQLM